MTSNPRAEEFRGWLPHFLRPQHVQSLTPVEFAQRLARTDMGAMLAQKAETEWQTLLNGVLERFDFYGQAAGEAFRQRAKAMSIIVSFVFAFALNINALALFYAFANRPQLADAMLAQQEEIQRHYEEAQKRAANAPPGATVNDAEAKQIQEDIRNRLDELKKQFGNLAQLGLPLGWSDKRCVNNADDEFCGALNELPQWRCAGNCGWREFGSASTAYVRAWAFFFSGHTRLLFSILLAGLLIGLGGPFWYNVCTSLSRAARMARVVADGVKGPPPKDGGAEESPASEPALLSTPARAFAAATVLHRQVPALGRVTLTPSGEREVGGRT
jgi:hypothetical protein